MNRFTITTSAFCGFADAEGDRIRSCKTQFASQCNSAEFYETPGSLLAYSADTKGGAGCQVPAVLRGGDLDLWLYGNVYACDDANWRVATGLFHSRETISEIRDLYEILGHDLYPKLRGNFILVIFDRQQGCLNIVNDRFGSIPCYYVNGNRWFGFSSSAHLLRKLSGIPKRLDYSSVADVLQFGFVTGNKTLLMDIRLLEGGSAVRCDLETGTVSHQRYWSLADHLQLSQDAIPNAERLERLVETFKRGVDRRLSTTGKTTVRLSGGLDSRAVIAAIDTSRFQVDALTAAFKGSSEHRMARKVCQASGCGFSLSELHIAEIVGNAGSCNRRLVEATDGMCISPYASLPLLTLEGCVRHGVGDALYGHGGELVNLQNAYQFALKPGEEARHDTIGRLIYGKIRYGGWRGLNTQELIADKELLDEFNNAPERIERLLRPIGNALPLEQQISFFFLEEFYRKFTVLNVAVHRRGVNPHLPFLDEEFVEQILATPVELRTGTLIHEAIIKKYRPKLLEIPISNTMVSLKPSLAGKLLVNIPYRIARRLGMFSQDHPETFILRNFDIRDCRDLLTKRRERPYDLFNVSCLSSTVDRFAAGEHGLLNVISAVSMLEAWIEAEFEGSNAGLGDN